MIRCIHDECQYPDCNHSCEMSDAEIINHLQDRVAYLIDIVEKARSFYSNNIQRLSKESVLFNGIKREKEIFSSVCIHGYKDCVNNPAYIRKYYPEWWVELGMPTSCDEENCCYDDEDK